MVPKDPARLRQIMYAAGMDTVHLANAAGVSRQYISLLLNGRRGCTRRTATAIAHALGAPPAAFFHPLLTGEEVNMMEDSVNTAAPDTDPLLLFKDVCKMFKFEAHTLRYLRNAGEGPPFFKRGRVLVIRESEARKWHAEKYERANA